MPQSIDPRTVVSPKNSVRNLDVIFDGGLGDDTNPRWSGWSMTRLTWEDSPAVAVRWNGQVGEGVGNPQSRGLPTWFVLPEPLAEIALDCLDQHLHGTSDDAAAKVVPPRRRLLDLISFVRSASDEELTHMIDQMGLKPARAF